MLDVINDQDAVGYGEAVMGAVLLGERGDRDLIDLVAANLATEDMPTDALSIIYSGALKLNKWGPVNLLTVTNHLREEGQLERVGGASYLSTLTDSIPDVAYAEWYAGLIRQHALTKRVKVASLAAHESPSPNNLAGLDEALKALEGWRNRRDDPDRGMSWDPTTAGEDVIPLGLGLGIAPGQLLMIAGPPKMGKSALALQLASYACSGGLPVLYVSLEMPDWEVWPRIIAPRVEYHDIEYRRLISRDSRDGLNEHEQEAISHAYEHYPGRGRFRVLTPDARYEEEGGGRWIRSWAEQDARRHGRPPLVVVDYLQAAVSMGSDNERLELKRLIYELRSLSMHLLCPVIAISSMARGYLDRGTKGGWVRPGEDTGKGSGDLTYAISGGQLTLWHSKQTFEQYIREGKPKPRTLDVELYIDNNRYGGDRVMALQFNRPLGRFDLTQEERQRRRAATGQMALPLDWRPDEAAS